MMIELALEVQRAFSAGARVTRNLGRCPGSLVNAAPLALEMSDLMISAAGMATRPPFFIQSLPIP